MSSVDATGEISGGGVAGGWRAEPFRRDVLIARSWSLVGRRASIDDFGAACVFGGRVCTGGSSLLVAGASGGHVRVWVMRAAASLRSRAWLRLGRVAPFLGLLRPRPHSFTLLGRCLVEHFLGAAAEIVSRGPVAGGLRAVAGELLEASDELVQTRLRPIDR